MTPTRIGEFAMRLQQARQMADPNSNLERQIITQVITVVVKECEDECNDIRDSEARDLDR